MNATNAFTRKCNTQFHLDDTHRTQQKLDQTISSTPENKRQQNKNRVHVFSPNGNRLLGSNLESLVFCSSSYDLAFSLILIRY